MLISLIIYNMWKRSPWAEQQGNFVANFSPTRFEPIAHSSKQIAVASNVDDPLGLCETTFIYTARWYYPFQPQPVQICNF